MDTDKVVVHDVKRNHRNVVLNLLGERVRKASGVAHVHSHVQNSSGDVGIVRRFT